MTYLPSARHNDPLLFCGFFGGPRDGLKSGDLPASLSGTSLTGMEMSFPLGEPVEYSLYAHYVCTSTTQVDGFWRFEFVDLRGPNGEEIVSSPADGAESVPTAIESQPAGPKATEPPAQVALRYKNAAYWWIVSELIRRHPKLELLETYPMDGFYDCLTLFGPGARGNVHIDFNRFGSIHIHPEHVHFLEAVEVMKSSDPHRSVRRIEEAAGLVPPSKTPPSSPRTITLRLMARLMNFLVNDKAAWQIQMLTSEASGYAISLLDTPEYAAGKSPLPHVFTRVEDFHAFLESSRFAQQTAPGRFWAVRRDDDVIAVFDTEGVVHTASARTSLRSLYARTNRNLTQTMAVALADVLP